ERECHNKARQDIRSDVAEPFGFQVSYEIAVQFFGLHAGDDGRRSIRELMSLIIEVTHTDTITSL
ncbi:hypothetical protein ACTGYQ_11445, partial [Streptococcus suis]